MYTEFVRCLRWCNFFEEKRVLEPVRSTNGWTNAVHTEQELDFSEV